MTDFDEQIRRILGDDSFVRRLAQSLCRDPHAGDDVLSDAVMIACRKPPPRGVDLGAWLTGVIRNLAWRARRAESRRTTHEDGARRADTTGPDSAAASIAEHEERRALLIAEVQQLSEHHRRAIHERFILGATPAEMAARAGIPANTARSQIHDALEALRTRLDARSAGSRERWMASLMPIAFPGLGGAAGVASSGKTGALIVTTKSKVLLAASAVALLGVSWPLFGGRGWFAGGGDGASAHGAHHAGSDGGRGDVAGADVGGAQGARLPIAVTPFSRPAATAYNLRVVDETGAAIAGAVAYWADPRVRTVQPTLEERFVTTADGATRVPACDDGRALAVFEKAHQPGVADALVADAVNVVVLKRGHQYRATFKDHAGNPVAGASIRIARYAPALFPEAAELAADRLPGADPRVLTRAAVSDETGKLVIGGLADGTWTVAFHHPDYLAMKLSCLHGVTVAEDVVEDYLLEPILVAYADIAPAGDDILSWGWRDDTPPFTDPYALQEFGIRFSAAHPANIAHVVLGTGVLGGDTPPEPRQFRASFGFASGPPMKPVSVPLRPIRAALQPLTLTIPGAVRGGGGELVVDVVDADGNAVPGTMLTTSSGPVVGTIELPHGVRKRAAACEYEIRLRSPRDFSGTVENAKAEVFPGTVGHGVMHLPAGMTRLEIVPHLPFAEAARWLAFTLSDATHHVDLYTRDGPLFVLPGTYDLTWTTGSFKGGTRSIVVPPGRKATDTLTVDINLEWP